MSKNWENDYEIINELGEGGNAKVFHVKCKKDNKEYALKKLTVGGKEKHCRFVNEINTIKANCQEIEGIIPICEFSENEYWYTMPIATPAINYIIKNELGIEEIIKAIISLSTTLEKLHEKNICHRDIKPSNIYFYNNRFVFGDFGLVDFPENLNDFTRSDRGLGAIFTIAPEMKRNPKEADSKKADVFSLAKTMWMFLTNNEKGFDGVYNYLDSSHCLRSFEQYHNVHLVELDELLKESTDNNPELRPTIEEFKKRLNNWLDIYSDEDKAQASDWNFLTKQLFGPIPSESASWRDIDKIVEVLNVIGNIPAYNHMFFHHGGGLDFSSAERADEKNCIKLYVNPGFCLIVKPKILFFEGFKKNYSWNYFLLELDTLSPIISKDESIDYEELVEDYPAHYVSAQYAQYGVYDYDNGNPLPKGFKKVLRYLKGKFLIVMKRGPYNGMSKTYDGRHGDCSASEFRNYIERLITISTLCHLFKSDDKLKNLSDEEIEARILNWDKFSENPFKKDLLNEDKIDYEKKFLDRKKSEDYIKQNFMKWSFFDILQNDVSTNSPAIKFVFSFLPNGAGCSLDNIKDIFHHYYICKDGYIKQINSFLDEECYCVYDRKIAIDLECKFKKRMTEILEQNHLAELDKSEIYFQVKAVRCGKPSHLFTKEEIEEAMKNADDRQDNILVIDENGYAKVIGNIEYSYLYPVRHELWCAGNMYVGKYSDLSVLNDSYISSLQGWLAYLEKGEVQFIDYVDDNHNEKDLIDKIKTYY